MKTQSVSALKAFAFGCKTVFNNLLFFSKISLIMEAGLLFLFIPAFIIFYFPQSMLALVLAAMFLLVGIVISFIWRPSFNLLQIALDFYDHNKSALSRLWAKRMAAFDFRLSNVIFFIFLSSLILLFVLLLFLHKILAWVLMRFQMGIESIIPFPLWISILTAVAVFLLAYIIFRFSLSGYFLLEGNAAAEAVKKSWHATKNHVAHLMLLMVIHLFIFIAITVIFWPIYFFVNLFLYFVVVSFFYILNNCISTLSYTYMYRKIVE